MALTLTYNVPQTAFGEIFTTTGGGTVFSANLRITNVFDYFSDTAVVNDAIYFSAGPYLAGVSDITLNVGTALNGATVVWEYYKRPYGSLSSAGQGWYPIEDLQDDTVGLTVIGSNRVRFPLQTKPYISTVNGLSRTWYRCRISAITTMVEGGANQTLYPKYSDGAVNLSGTTDAVPATFEDIYTWMKTNYPYITTITKRNNYSYDFTKIVINMGSRLKTTLEIVETGQNCMANENVGINNWDYLESGTKLGNRGYNGSTFIIYGVSNSNCFRLGTNAKSYGSIFKGGKEAGYGGYVITAGDLYDNVFELALQSPVAGSVIKNSKVSAGLLIASSSNMSIFDGMIYVYSGVLFYLYSAGFTINNWEIIFKQATGNYIFNLYRGTGRQAQEWVMLNPVNTIPLRATGNYACAMSASGLYAWDKVWYYDASAGTYTDYTIPASDATANDVPLTGDVGDMLYFGGVAESSLNGLNMYVTMSAVTNDYVYAWEYYYGSTWHTLTPDWIWDDTNNLSKSGYGLFGVEADCTSLAVNGFTAKWLRARIVTKGTANPIANRIQRRDFGMVGKWSVREKYSFDIKVVDATGAVINGATVTGYDQNGTQIFSANTDVTGVIASQTTTYKEFKLDPTDYAYFWSETVFTTMSFKIEKAGYETYTSTGIQLGSKINQTITLNPIVPIRQTFEGDLFLANDAVLGSSSKLLKL